MWFGGVAGATMAFLATTALAAPGDALVVTGDVVNVRAGPGTRNPVLFHVARDQEVVELSRSGDWIQVQVPGQAEGWIHQSLLKETPRPQPPAPGPAGAAPSPGGAEAPAEAARSPERTGAGAPPPESQAIVQFRNQVTELNARAMAVAGVELFAGADAVDDGTARVTVTEAWELVPEAGQESYTNALFDHWRAAAGSSEPLRLQIVDPSGAVVSERSGPALP